MDTKRDGEPSSAKNRTAVERTSERELVVARTFNGPAHLVYEAWTNPDALLIGLGASTTRQTLRGEE